MVQFAPHHVQMIDDARLPLLLKEKSSRLSRLLIPLIRRQSLLLSLN